MTWNEFEKEIKKLTTKIDSPIDIIVPIARGGFVPGRRPIFMLKPCLQ